ncbi:MAG: hypothetical protein NXI12_12840 [Alphaproteobacteria bacterium]|nr:hypothetical protein [Alphaproteobacteria bacterium]
MRARAVTPAGAAVCTIAIEAGATPMTNSLNRPNDARTVASDD